MVPYLLLAVLDSSLFSPSFLSLPELLPTGFFFFSEWVEIQCLHSDMETMWMCSDVTNERAYQQCSVHPPSICRARRPLRAFSRLQLGARQYRRDRVQRAAQQAKKKKKRKATHISCRPWPAAKRKREEVGGGGATCDSADRVLWLRACL